MNLLVFGAHFEIDQALVFANLCSSSLKEATKRVRGIRQHVTIHKMHEILLKGPPNQGPPNTEQKKFQNLMNSPNSEQTEQLEQSEHRTVRTPKILKKSEQLEQSEHLLFGLWWTLTEVIHGIG